ncbi:MAG: IS1182 family transposase [Euryarchaeota archaeon]|nr:IS1182 family transposase [Euryarchaeota archaeon]
MDYIQGFDRKQEILFPAKIDDYIEEENLVHFIEAFVALLDLMVLGFTHAEVNSTGRPSYNPADLLKLYIYGYLNRIRSSRKLEKECFRNIEVMWLLKKLAPDHKTIADFRKNNPVAIKKVFKEFVLFCKELDLYGGEVVSTDGSKFKAVNSKKRNFNAEKLLQKLKDIEEKIAAYLKELEENDKIESSIKLPDAKELKEKIQQMEERKKEYEGLQKTLETTGETQISLTDPDSRMMMGNQKFDVSYNVQTTVDAKNNLILDYEVTNEGNDKNQLNEMATRAKDILEVESLEVLADKGYYNPEEIRKCTENNIIPIIPEPKPKQFKEGNVPEPEYYENQFKYDSNKDVYTCPGGRELAYSGDSIKNKKNMREYKSDCCNTCEFKSKCTTNKNVRVIFRWEHEKVLEDMRERVKNNPDSVRKRNCMSEHPFGTIKRGFNQGYFLTKGLVKVAGEMGLTMLAYNIRRVINILGMNKLMEIMNPG